MAGIRHGWEWRDVLQSHYEWLIPLASVQVRRTRPSRTGPLLLGSGALQILGVGEESWRSDRRVVGPS